MSIQIGGYIPDFRYKLNVTQRDPFIVTSGSTGIATGQVIDANAQTISYTNALTGTQYNIQVVPERYYINGVDRVAVLSSNLTGISQISQDGDTTFVSTGRFNIAAYSVGVNNQPDILLNVSLSNISGGGATSIVTNYIADTIIPSKHILVVYNSGSVNSTNLKTYYTGNRPLFSGANVLALACPSGENISYNAFLTGIRNPIVTYLTGVSGSKPIKYIINMMDIPTRITDTVTDSVPMKLSTSFKDLGLRNGSNYEGNNNHFTLAEYQGKTALISYINFGNYTDCTGYIERISRNQTGLYLTGNTNNTGYYIDDTNILYTSFPTFCSGRYLRPILNEYPSIKYLYNPIGGAYVTTGNNLAGFITWGAHAGRGPNYATNGQIKWGGNNNWYIMTTIESYNGIYDNYNTSQGNFTGWFSRGAFGGPSYEKCPVGAVCHNNEPGLFGVANTGFFLLWQRGYPFIEAAWQSRITRHFLAIGDPLVVK